MFLLQKPVPDLKFPSLLPPNPPLKLLLIFHKHDPVIEAFANACHRLDINVTMVKSTESAIELFQSPTTGGHHIVVIDGRISKFLDAEAFGRTLRSCKGSQHTVLLCVVKKR